MEKTFHVQWHITNHCTLRCRHCYQDDFTPAADLPFSALEKIAGSLLDFVRGEGRRLTINVTGGEPLLHPAWRDLVRLLAASPDVKDPGIITNGLLFTEETIRFLEEVPSIGVRLSLEGATRETYEYYRGRDTWDAFEKTVSLVRSSGRETLLMFTLLEENAGEVERLFAFAERRGIGTFIVERFIPWGRGARAGGRVVGAGTWTTVQKTILERCGLEPDISVLLPYRAFLLRRDRDGGWEPFGAPCVVGTDGCAVMPDGTVFPCRRLPLSVGNCTETPFAEIWRTSPVLQTARERRFLKGRCGSCSLEACLGCRALAFSLLGDFLGEDPLCLKGEDCV